MVDASRLQLQLSHKKCKHFLRHSLCMLLHGYNQAEEVGARPIHYTGSFTGLE